MSIRFNSEVRDYGGSDYGFKDQILDDYVVVDLGTRYKIFKGLDIDFKLINLFDKDYQQALNYQGHPRQFSVGLSKSF